MLKQQIEYIGGEFICAAEFRLAKIRKVGLKAYFVQLSHNKINHKIMIHNIGKEVNYSKNVESN